LSGERREQMRNRMKTTFIAVMLVVTLIYLYLEMMNFV
jgi:predicted nucleic acid-binding Zn ribbon protein